MLLPFDLRADREGWTVFEIATDQAASLDGLRLTGLCLEDAEDAVNALNRLEIACRRKARKMMDLPTPQELPAIGVISPLPHSMRLGRHHRWTKRRDEGRLRPPPLRHLRRQQAGCERHCDANAVTQSSRNMAGAPFAGFHRRS